MNVNNSFGMKESIENFVDSIIPWLLNHGIRIVFIAVFAYILIRILNKFIERAVRLAVVADSQISPDSEKKREETLIHIFKFTIKVVIWIIAGLMILEEFGVQIAPILAAAGIVGIAFGFGGQYLIKDIISGLFIILENQYRIGDIVAFDKVSGLVENITLRKTTLRDMDGTVHHIPHGEVKTVSNYSKDFSRINLNVGIAYNSDLEKVIRLVNKVGQELFNDDNFKEMLVTPPQFLRVDNLEDSSVVIKIVADTKPLKQWELTGELRKRLLIAFNKEGIEIPFPQRVVHNLK
ncbi:MAG TPA: mechanosensitive ion channel family protein [Bacteroidales bacterium]|nr:mechanosensitive ion channel family protein [Bacteroidales bacterium]